MAPSPVTLGTAPSTCCRTKRLAITCTSRRGWCSSPKIFGELIGVPINYGVIQWVIRTKGEFVTGKVTDPLHQWTGQMLQSYNTMAVQYVLVGPARLFKEHIYRPLPYAFVFGAVAPFILYAFHRMFPRARFN